MYITRPYQIQVGLGLKVYREIGGENIFSTIKKYALPAGKYLYRKVLTPFVKNNRHELKRLLNKESMTIIKRLASGKRPHAPSTAKFQEILQSKSLSDHLRGEGIIKRRRTKIPSAISDF